MLGDDSTKTLLGRLDRSVNERQLSNVVLVDHSEDGFLLSDVHLWVLNLVLVRCLQLSLNTWQNTQSLAQSFVFSYIFNGPKQGKDLKDRILTKPSSGIRPKVSCFGLRWKVPRGAGRPLEVRQLISDSFARFYRTQ